MRHLIFLLITFPFILCAQGQSTEAILTGIKGNWVNQQASTLSIDSIDSATGQITGTYISPSGTTGESYSITGWVNVLPLPSTHDAQVHNAVSITFSVQWGEYGSVTAWTGIYDYRSDDPTIHTNWHLVRSNAPFDWAHILTGADVFQKG